MGSNHKSDTRGDTFAEIILDANFITINNGDHTFKSDSNGLTSAIDITLAHSTISNKLDWNRIFENLGSDHFILDIIYNTKQTESPNQIKNIHKPQTNPKGPSITNLTHKYIWSIWKGITNYCQG